MLRVLISALFAVSITACATPFYVSVDSIAATSPKQFRTYLMLPGNEDGNFDDLQYKEYSAYLAKALAEKGYVPADSFETADLAVVLSYGISDPQTQQYTYSLPVYGQTGVSSSTTTGTAYSYGNSTTISANTTYTPSYGVTGYSTHVGSVTTFFRFARIEAYDLAEYRESDRQLQIWSTKIVSTGTSGDLRRIFPMLIAAGYPYLGTNTGKRIDLTMHEGDKSAKWIRGEQID